MERLDSSQFKGVIYFDDDQQDWALRGAQGQTWPRHSAPVTEWDAFVYYDESRCRGADMRLRPDDQAVLSLGPDMGKDKLMQVLPPPALRHCRVGRAEGCTSGAFRHRGLMGTRSLTV